MMLLLGWLACTENQTPYAPYVWEDDALCLPNIDGQIEASEFPLQDSGVAVYRVASSVSVDFAIGRTTDDVPIWDFSAAMDGEDLQQFDVYRVSDTDDWPLTDFPQAQWLISNDSSSESVGVYTFEDALSLLGTTSTDSNENLWRYQEPVPILRFPLVVGDGYSVQGVIEQGQINGLPFVGVHHYDVTISARGELWLENVRFTDVYRVNTLLTVRPSNGQDFSVHQSSFFSECAGELVRLQSPINASDFSFESIDHIRVLSF